jgi:hypothetical protein
MMDPELRITEVPSGYIISKDGHVLLLSIPDCQRLVARATTDHPEYFEPGNIVSSMMNLVGSMEPAMDAVVSKQKILNDAPSADKQLPEFVCKPGDPRVNKYGWKLSQFSGFLSLDGNTIWISVVESRRPGCGHFSKMIRKLHAAGFTIKVPRPTDHMNAICEHLGFVRTEEIGDIAGTSIAVWIMHPPEDYYHV